MNVKADNGAKGSNDIPERQGEIIWNPEITGPSSPKMLPIRSALPFWNFTGSRRLMMAETGSDELVKRTSVIICQPAAISGRVAKSPKLEVPKVCRSCLTKRVESFANDSVIVSCIETAHHLCTVLYLWFFFCHAFYMLNIKFWWDDIYAPLFNWYNKKSLIYIFD